MPKPQWHASSWRDKDKTDIYIQVEDFGTTDSIAFTSRGSFRISDAIASRLEAMDERLNETVVHFSTADSLYIEAIAGELYEKVQSSIDDSTEDRRKRLEQRKANGNVKPKSHLVVVRVFDRDADVVAEVLSLAGGVCGRCKLKAPFKRKRDGTWYLEVHHRKRLADGGEDTVENSICTLSKLSSESSLRVTCNERHL